jgi:hypothetical protein
MAYFRRNPQWLPEWLRSDDVEQIVREKGDEVLAAAHGFAAEHVDTGHFEESLRKVDGHYSTGRPYSRVYSDDDASLSIEFGTKHSEPVRALGRAIRTV